MESTPLFRTAFAFAFAFALGTTWTPVAQAQDLPRDIPVGVACYEAAGEQTTLDEEEREALCRGARSAAPSTCFAETKDETVLDDDLAIRLCRCARSTEPLACYQRGDDDTPTLEDQQLVESCRPVVRRRLDPVTCRPLPR